MFVRRWPVDSWHRPSRLDEEYISRVLADVGAHLVGVGGEEASRMIIPSHMAEPLVQCKLCQRSILLRYFEIICPCPERQGICIECYEERCPQPRDQIATVRDFGWDTLGGEHTLLRRNQAKFEDLASLDPDYRDPNGPYLRYSSPDGRVNIVTKNRDPSRARGPRPPPPPPPVATPARDFRVLAILTDLAVICLALYAFISLFGMLNIWISKHQ